MRQVSPKSSWEERVGKNGYKRRRGAIEEGIEKSLESKCKEE